MGTQWISSLLLYSNEIKWRVTTVEESGISRLAFAAFPPSRCTMYSCALVWYFVGVPYRPHIASVLMCSSAFSRTAVFYSYCTRTWRYGTLYPPRAVDLAIGETILSRRGCLLESARQEVTQPASDTQMMLPARHSFRALALTAEYQFLHRFSYD